ncbi:MAG: hypothetical protein A2X49_02275 [Lentisphaerae bacterium GWF2_52_8]|nr:MAG: hypothetical protein A2X49_02275 [Lentisphaerae bacterium GWF2_52_8]
MTVPEMSPRRREATEWMISYWYNANDSKLPRVLLIGDSICNGYQYLVRDELAGVAYVSFYATSKCVSDPSYLSALSFMLGEYDYELIHFNNGLHSLDTDRASWELGLKAALDLISAKGKGAKIVWASSTPLKDPSLTRKAGELNAIAGKIMAERGIPVNDLFALMDPLDRDEFWCDVYHHKEEAKKMQARKIADLICKALLSRQA